MASPIGLPSVRLTPIASPRKQPQYPDARRGFAVAMRRNRYASIAYKQRTTDNPFCAKNDAAQDFAVHSPRMARQKSQRTALPPGKMGGSTTPDCCGLKELW